MVCAFHDCADFAGLLVWMRVVVFGLGKMDIGCVLVFLFDFV